MPLFRFASVFVLFVLAGCASQPAGPLASHYCDRHMGYEMCAQDLTDNGRVDVLYFEDTGEVFMYDPELSADLLANQALHRCVQEMDEGMLDASTQLLTIPASESALYRIKVKNRLLLNYARYLGDINACWKGGEGEALATQDSEANQGEDSGQLATDEGDFADGEDFSDDFFEELNAAECDEPQALVLSPEMECNAG